MDRENMSYSINPIKKPIDDKNTFYIQNNTNYFLLKAFI